MLSLGSAGGGRPCPPHDSEARERFVAAMARAAAGVSIVTTDGAHGRFALTVSSIASVSLDPPLVLACINRKSPLASAITGNRVFCLNVLGQGQSALADTFAGRARDGRHYDFAAARWRAGRTGAPRLAGAAAGFDCVLRDAHDAGTHRIFIGRVVAAVAGRARPLVYSARDYRALAGFDT